MKKVYIHIVTPKVHVSTALATFIYFCDIQKKNGKKIIYLFIFNFWVRLGYANSSTQKIFYTGTTPFLEYQCFIANLHFKEISLSLKETHAINVVELVEI